MKWTKNYFLLVLFVLFCGCSGIRSVFQPLCLTVVRCDIQFDRFINHYYLHPEEANLIPCLRYYLGSYKNYDGYRNAVHFFAAAIRNSDHRDELVADLHQLQGEVSEIKQRAIQDVISEIDHFVSPPATSSDNLDLIWAEFFATGRDDLIKKIAFCLSMDHEQDRMEVIFLSVAQWSLASNAAQHKKVFETLQDMNAHAHGIMKRRLQRILDNPEKFAKQIYNANKKGLDYEEFKTIVW